MKMTSNSTIYRHLTYAFQIGFKRGLFAFATTWPIQILYISYYTRNAATTANKSVPKLDLINTWSAF